MNDQTAMSSPEVRALLEHERLIAPLPPSVRAHVLSRARAALVAEPVPVRRTVRVTSGNRWAAAAALIAVTALAAGAAGAGAYAIRAQKAAAHRRDGRAAVALERVRPVTAARIATAASETETETQPSIEEQPAPVAAIPHLSRAEELRAELRLLRQARAAIAGERFAAALIPIEEHTRRFKDGRLAEEREALRVKALAALGRIEEARRAAATFQSRFPRSVLSPAVSRMPALGTSSP